MDALPHCSRPRRPRSTPLFSPTTTLTVPLSRGTSESSSEGDHAKPTSTHVGHSVAQRIPLHRDYVPLLSPLKGGRRTLYRDSATQRSGVQLSLHFFEREASFCEEDEHVIEQISRL